VTDIAGKACLTGKTGDGMGAIQIKYKKNESKNSKNFVHNSRSTADRAGKIARITECIAQADLKRSRHG
jgi:hypothetical protein